MGTTTQPSILVHLKWIGLAIGAVVLANPSQAAINIKISTAAIESPAVVLESDFYDNDPATNRHQVPASVLAVFERLAGDPAIVGDFRVAYSVIDSEDTKVKLETTGSDPFEAYSDPFNVNLTGGQTSALETVAINFDPIGILAKAPGYRLVTDLQKFNGVEWKPTDVPTVVSLEEPILHFTQKSSNDSSWNISAMLTEVEWVTTTMLTGGMPSGFQVSAEAMLGRYDEFDFPIDNESSVLEWDFDLRLAGSFTQIPLLNDGIVHQIYKPDSYEIQGGRPFPVIAPAATVVTSLVPQIQLNSVSGDYVLTCTLRYLQGSGSNFVNISELDAEEEQVMQFNGNLTTAGVDGVFDEISNSPVRGATGLGYVETQIRIPAGAGSLPQIPELNFGSNDLLTVRLKPNGDAQLMDGFYVVTPVGNPGAPWSGLVGSYSVTYGEVTFSGEGLQAANLQLNFGQGTVLMTTPAQRETKRGQASFLFTENSVQLDEEGNSSIELSELLPADSQVVAEEFPIVTTVSAISLSPSGVLTFTPVSAEYIHADALAILENDASAGLHDEPEMQVRRSNDGYLRFVDGVDSTEVAFDLAADGTARLECIFSIDAGSFEPHFPTESVVSWDGGANRLVLEDGEPAEGSKLFLVNDIFLSYNTTCADDRCAEPGDGAVEFNLTPLSNEMGFVQGGGLLCEGFVDENQKIEWGARGDGMGGVGDPTHEISNVGLGAFFMPGQHLYALDNTVASLPFVEDAADQSPNLLLNATSGLTGNPNLPADTSLYGSLIYRNGLGNHAGLNFTSVSDSDPATSRLGGGEMTYLLEGSSDYYIRYSGVTGRHVAQQDSWSPTLIYNYPFDFSKFQMTFRSSEPVLNWVEGQLSVDGATTFTQRFLDLSITCTGDLGPARLDPTDLGDKPLVYWGGFFTPRAMTFAKGPPSGPCDRPPAKLVFGSTIAVSNIPTPLHGPIGIEPDGRLTTIETAFEGVDSRFGIPPRISYGPEGTPSYSLVPSGKLYFNNPTEDEIDGPGIPSGGFATFGASVDVPYFRNLRTQAITYPAGLASDSFDSLLYLVPGWTEGGESFFTNTAFDPAHKGYPRGAIDFGDYREPNSSVADEFLIKAEQKMFGLVELSYPLRWDIGGAFFESMETQEDDLFVARLDHEVSFLDAKFADLSFGASYDGLPRIRLTDVLNEGINEVSGAMTEVLGEGVKGAIDSGLEGFDRLLGDSFESMMANKLSEIEEEVVATLYHNIAFSYSFQRQFNLDVEAGLIVGDIVTFEEWRDTELKDLLDSSLFDLESSTGALVDGLNSLGDDIEEANSFLKEVDDTVLDLIALIDSLVNQIRVVDGEINYEPDPFALGIPAQEVVRGFLQEFEPTPGAEPARVLFANLVRTLLIEMTPEEVRIVIQPFLEAETNEFLDELNGLLDEIEPALERLVFTLNVVREQLKELHEDLEEAEGVATVFGTLVAGAATEIGDIAEAVRGQAASLVERSRASAGIEVTAGLHLGTELFVTGELQAEAGDLGQEQFVRGLSATIRDELLQSELIRQYRFQLRQLFFDVEERVASAIQSIFSQANEVMSGFVKDKVEVFEEEINDFLGEASDFMGAGDLEGFARIRGDSLRQLRLDGAFEVKVPDEMRFNAYLEVNNVTAEDNFTENGCLSPGDRTVEVKVGATDVGIDWIADDLNAELIELRVSLKDFADDGLDVAVPNGIGGSFVIGGEFDFQGVEVSGIRATFGLAVDPFTPANSECYLGGGATMKLSGYGVTGAVFFGRTCTLAPLELVDPDLAALLGSAPFTGGYLYGEAHLPISESLLGIPASCMFQISADLGVGAFFFAEGPVLGGKMTAGISGEALCLVSIGGRVEMTGLVDDGKMKYSGTGTVSGKAGACPFCLRFRKSIGITYGDGDWSVDL